MALSSQNLGNDNYLYLIPTGNEYIGFSTLRVFLSAQTQHVPQFDNVMTQIH